MTIKNKAQFDDFRAQLEAILPTITQYENEIDIPEADLATFRFLSGAIYEWELAHHPLPGKISSLITDVAKTKTSNSFTKI